MSEEAFGIYMAMHIRNRAIIYKNGLQDAEGGFGLVYYYVHLLIFLGALISLVYLSDVYVYKVFPVCDYLIALNKRFLRVRQAP